MQLYGQVGAGDDLLQLEQLLEQQLSEMELLGKDPAAAAAAMQAPAGRSAAAAAAVNNLGVGVGAATAAAAAAAAWQAGYDGDVDTATGSSSSKHEDDDDDGSSSSSGSHESVRYRPVEGAAGRPTSANRIERLVAMYRQQQSAQQQQHAVEGSPELARRGSVEHVEELGSDGAGSEAAGVSEMLSRFLQE
jgi:hypothetical protein